MKELQPYSKPNTTRSIAELVVTVVPFIISWVLIWAGLNYGSAFVLVLALPAAGLLLRLFIIQHDCGHGAFFKSRRANDWLGRCLGVLTLTPYAVWRHAHARHHATSGNLELRGIGDIDTLTVSEYLSKNVFQRLRYRIYRHPAVMFGIGPAYLFLLRHRLPIGQMRGGWKPWGSTIVTNAAIIGSVAGLSMLIGFWPFVAVHLPITVLAASFGVWLFYIQHQFEETVWENGDTWTVHASSLYGSSNYDLPRILHWFTGNIGFHHVHHLVSRIPFYRLADVMRDRPDLGSVGRVTTRQSFRGVCLALWDERKRRLVSFRTALHNDLGEVRCR